MCIAVLGTVPRVRLQAEDEPHAGQMEFVVRSTNCGFETTCRGPASIHADAAGFEAVAACGLGVPDDLYTVEATASGSIASDGTLTGDIAFTVLDVTGSVDGSLTGAPEDGTFSASGTWASGDIQIDGSWSVSAP